MRTLHVPRVHDVLEAPGLTVHEPAGQWTREPATFVADLSGDVTHHSLLDTYTTDRHGSYDRVLTDALVFGHHHLHAFITEGETFNCQDISGYDFRIENYINNQPDLASVVPTLSERDGSYFIDTDLLTPEAITEIRGSVLFGTPIEPYNWGMWLLHALPIAMEFRRNRKQERLFINMAHAWQRNLLHTVGLVDEQLVDQQLGRTYSCGSVGLRQYSQIDLIVSPLEREAFERTTRALLGSDDGPARRKIFVSRRSTTKAFQGRYRALLNEDELISAFEDRGFEIVEPEKHTLQDQARMFNGAGLVVGLGGAALFNVVFSRPGTRVVTIESSAQFVHNHAALFTSLGHKYGVIFGRQDEADTAPVHRRWSIDVARAMSVIDQL